MKKYCNNVNILDKAHIKKAVLNCLERKKYRSDVVECLLNKKISYNEYHTYKLNVMTYDYNYTEKLYDDLVDRLYVKLCTHNLNLIPIEYEKRWDKNAKKYRTIAIQSMEQQVLDYVAIEAMKPDLLKRIGEFQIAGIKGRGNQYGVKALTKWLEEDVTCFVKNDIAKCYESINHNKLMKFLRTLIDNNELLWLIEELISTHQQGLSIGSLLSQYLCNLYLSQAYHYIKETAVVNNHRLKHIIFQMDDIILIHDNIDELKEFYKLLEVKLNELGFTFKNQPRFLYIQKFNEKYTVDKSYIDLVGFKFYKNNKENGKPFIEKRGNSYLAMNRTFLRTMANYKKGYINVEQARTFTSYYGMLNATKCTELKKKYKDLNDVCRKIVSKYDRGGFMKTVTIYTDGACKKGVGGIGIIMLYESENGKKYKKILSKQFQDTTNQRMELEAVIYALSRLKEPCKVHLYTDSQYVTNIVNLGWIRKWQIMGWINKNAEPVANKDLLQKLAKFLYIHDVKIEWIKGHNGNEFNEECDKLAKEKTNK